MELFDPNMTQRVWLRVQGTAQEDPLPPMVLQTQTCAAACGRLSKHFRAREAELLKMRTALLRQVECLKGIHYLRTGQRIPLPGPSSTQEPADALLRGCIGQCLRLAEAQRRASASGEYGPIFASLAVETTSYLQLLLELAGK